MMNLFCLGILVWYFGRMPHKQVSQISELTSMTEYPEYPATTQSGSGADFTYYLPVVSRLRVEAFKHMLRQEAGWFDDSRNSTGLPTLELWIRIQCGRPNPNLRI